MLPSANVSRLISGDSNASAPARGRLGEPINIHKLSGFLQANRRGERYVLGTSSSLLAAPIIINTGAAVMAMGGFHGLDPILTPEKLAQMVEGRQIRFVMVGDLSVISRRLGAEAARKPVADWVRAHGKLVDPTLWRASSPDTRLGDDDNQARGRDNAPDQVSIPTGPDTPREQPSRGPRGPRSRMQLYDLRPAAGIVPVSSD